MKRPVYVNLITGGDIPWAYNLLDLACSCEGETFSIKVRATPEGVDPDLGIDLEDHNHAGVPLSRAMRDLNRWLDRQCKLHSCDELLPVSWRAGLEQMWLRRCEYIAALEIDHVTWDDHIDLRSMCITAGLDHPTYTPWSLVDAYQMATGVDTAITTAPQAVQAMAAIGRHLQLEQSLPA